MALQVDTVQLQVNVDYLQCVLHSNASDHIFVLVYGNLYKMLNCLMHDNAFNVRRIPQSLQAHEALSSGHMFGIVHPKP